MSQLLVRNLDESLVRDLKKLAAASGLSTEEQHRRLLAKAVKAASVVKEPLASYLVKHPISPDLEIPLERSKKPEHREIGF